jgi:hypothetical protein
MDGLRRLCSRLLGVWNGRARGGFVGGLGRRIRRFAFAGGTREVGVLELDEELPGAHFRALLHVDFLDGRRDLGNDRGLLQRVHESLRANGSLDLRAQDGRNIDADDGSLFRFFFLATSGNQETRDDSDQYVVRTFRFAVPGGPEGPHYIQQRHI